MSVSRWESSCVVALAAAVTCAITAERAFDTVRRVPRQVSSSAGAPTPTAARPITKEPPWN